MGIAVAAALAFAVITLLHVVIGELAPKSVAISRTTETALRVVPLLRVFYLSTRPLVDLFNGLGNLVLRPFGIAPAREVGHAPHSEGELLELLAESREHGLIEVDEQELAERGFAFADRRAGQVMTLRAEIEFLPVDVGVEQAARHVVQSRHTRLPVCERQRGLDAPIGLVHAHDLLAAALGDASVELEDSLRPLARVPESTPVTELLGRMRDERREMVLVADSHGATVGLVTLEDLLEQLVGEIEDEPLPRANGISRAAAPSCSRNARVAPFSNPGTGVTLM